MSYRGVLFDFDGVVVKSMEQHFNAWKSAFAEVGAHITQDEFFVLEGQGIGAISSQIGEVHGLKHEQVEHAMKRKVDYYNQFMNIEFYPHFKEMLKYLHEQKIPKGIVTGGNRDRVQKTVEKYFDDEFDFLVTVDDVERGKPFPDPFLKGAELLGFAPKECIVVENAPLGVKAAKAAGITTIAVMTTLRKEHLKQADFVVNDFKEVEALLIKMLNINPA